MISNPELMFYACVAKKTTIVAEFNSRDADLNDIALKCLEKAPSLHSTFSQTVRDKTYMFLFDHPFQYFAIFDQRVENSEGLSFLRSVKDAFEAIPEADLAGRRLDSLSSHCFQGEFNPVFHQLLASPVGMEGLLGSPNLGLGSLPDRSGGLDSPRDKKIGSVPLLGDASKSLKKKKRMLFGGSSGEFAADENKVDVGDNMGFSRELSVGMHKNGLFGMDSGHQKAKRVWKTQVWVVLSLDLIVCIALFVVWLWICRGFKCVDG